MNYEMPGVIIKTSTLLAAVEVLVPALKVAKPVLTAPRPKL